jgi:hypothetical protein
VLAQRAGPVAAELDVIGHDRHVLLAQIFGQDATDFAVADKANGPLLRVGQGHG